MRQNEIKEARMIEQSMRVIPPMPTIKGSSFNQKKRTRDEFEDSSIEEPANVVEKPNVPPPRYKKIKGNDWF
jgi:hypothetical protein